MQRFTPSRCRRGGRRASRGFTLIETLIAVGIAGVLSSIAYPSLESQVLRARRSDAMVSLMNAQLAQERHRANHRSYGDLAAIGVRPTSLSGHYTIEVAASATDAYELVATATGRQARDAGCQTLRLAVAGASVVYASGPDAAASNAATLNRKCWNQ
ncbi:MAG: prepilin-type N-terminal cleavage/methylation domain-containing protein [Burkholderiales bacterium]|nr:prepilin-type N-terminal cleavage/methylation domain-containing protein [Burkholderiales bacterium]